MVKEYVGEAFEKPKTWWGRFWDFYPSEYYENRRVLSIADCSVPNIPKEQIPT